MPMSSPQITRMFGFRSGIKHSLLSRRALRPVGGYSCPQPRLFVVQGTISVIDAPSRLAVDVELGAARCAFARGDFRLAGRLDPREAARSRRRGRGTYFTPPPDAEARRSCFWRALSIASPRLKLA